MTCHGDSQGKPARLEGAGGIGALLFEMNALVAPAAEHRRPAFTEGDRLNIRQDGAVTPHAPPAG
jgi:hypothetical protein